MIIEKVMNNNCVQASMNGQEVIISGPGVGYNKKYGMSVPEHPANRIFYVRNEQKNKLYKLIEHVDIGFAPIFPDICYHLTHYKPAAADIPVASDNPAHYADAIRYNARTPLQGSLLPLTRLVWA